MNIYDLEKQATAAPWFGRYSTVLGRTAPESPREQHICSTDENWLPCEEKIANGALIRHCRNNYMDALLTIKECREILDSEYPDHDPRHPSQWLDRELKELEEVEL